MGNGGIGWHVIGPDSAPYRDAPEISIFAHDKQFRGAGVVIIQSHPCIPLSPTAANLPYVYTTQMEKTCCSYLDLIPPALTSSRYRHDVEA